MKISVPTNWQSDLIGRIDLPGVDLVYGKLDRDFVGGGRPSCIFLKVNKNKAREHIAQIHKTGRRFNYLLNASCLGNNEWTMKGQRQLNNLLDWVTEVEADGVVVAIPYLCQLIKKRYPHFEISVSCFAQIDSVEKAKFWEDMGVSVITLSQTELTRDFRMLRKIRENVKCQLQLIVNDSCIQDCPVFFYHNNMVSHASQTTSKLGSFTIDFCRFACRYRILEDHSNIIKTAWIRPEDMNVYEQIGIDRFKIVGRNMLSEAIALIAKAYSDRSYRGNLYDLFGNPSKSLWLQKDSLWHKLKYFFHPFTINIFRLIKEKRLLKDMDVYIDNSKLDGFIKYFLKEDCRYKSCRECGYCKKIAEEAVTIDPGHGENTASNYKRLVDDAVSGKIFKF